MAHKLAYEVPSFTALERRELFDLDPVVSGQLVDGLLQDSLDRS
jgi:hypothetical protein